jgi:hypothetical protein
VVDKMFIKEMQHRPFSFGEGDKRDEVLPVKELQLKWKNKMFSEEMQHRLFSLRRRGREMRFE